MKRQDYLTFGVLFFTKEDLINLVGTGGFAPPTLAMSMQCSTPELSARRR